MSNAIVAMTICAVVYVDEEVLGVKEIDSYMSRVAEHFGSYVGASLVEAYKLGSLAHGGFSHVYSDLDLGLVLNCLEPPTEMSALIVEAKALNGDYGKKLSVFWGNPDCSWGRLPVIDRLDLLDHGIPLLNNHRPEFRRPTKEEIRYELLQSIAKSWKPRLPDLSRLTRLQPENRKPYIRAILYPARMIYSWDNLAVDSNDRAVEYLRSVKPSGLDLAPIEAALACRHDECTAEDVFALATDLRGQYEKTMTYISES